MTAIKAMMTRFLKDDAGASFLEYTVLLAIILVASILTIRAVGTWAANQWSALNTVLNAT